MDWICTSCIADEFFTAEPSAKPMILYTWPGNTNQLLHLKSNGSPGIASATLYKCQESSHAGDIGGKAAMAPSCPQVITVPRCLLPLESQPQAVGRHRLTSVSLSQRCRSLISWRGHSQDCSRGYPVCVLHLDVRFLGRVSLNVAVTILPHQSKLQA